MVGFGVVLICVVGVVMNVLILYMVNGNEWNWEFKMVWFYVGFGMFF